MFFLKFCAGRLVDSVDRYHSDFLEVAFCGFYVRKVEKKTEYALDIA